MFVATQWGLVQTAAGLYRPGQGRIQSMTKKKTGPSPEGEKLLKLDEDLLQRYFGSTSEDLPEDKVHVYLEAAKLQDLEAAKRAKMIESLGGYEPGLGGYGIEEKD